MIVTFIGDGRRHGAAAGDSPGGLRQGCRRHRGNAADKITTGRGSSYVDGRGGDDVIVTGDTGGPASAAWVAGGDNNDTISVGNGDDRVTGDASLGSARDLRTVKHNGQDGDGTKDLDRRRLGDPLTPTTQDPGTNRATTPSAWVSARTAPGQRRA